MGRRKHRSRSQCHQSRCNKNQLLKLLTKQIKLKRSKRIKGGAISFMLPNGKFSGGNITNDLKKLGCV